MRLTCAHKTCGKLFEPNTHNQKYCSPECCKEATNAKIMERYYERKAIKAGKARACFSCGTSLSRYNESRMCNSCDTKQERERNNSVLALLLAMNG